MKLYIVMPVINCFSFTKPAFESIRSSVSTGFILIDNASVDDTVNWGKAHHNDKDFIYIRNDQAKSVSASWNQGIKKAFEDEECQYVAVLNNDIILHPKTLDHLRLFLDKTKYMMVTGDNVKDRMSPATLMKLELPLPFTDFDLQEINEWRAEGPDFSCYMIGRDTIKYIGWFDENFIGAYCEDWDYHARINRANRWAKQYGEPPANRMHAKRLSTAPYFHFASRTLSENTVLRPVISMNHGKNKEYYFRKWGADHPEVMDGKGNITPFGDASRNWTHI